MMPYADKNLLTRIAEEILNRAELSPEAKQALSQNIKWILKEWG
jgi:hypothetical protein